MPNPRKLAFLNANPQKFFFLNANPRKLFLNANPRKLIRNANPRKLFLNANPRKLFLNANPKKAFSECQHSESFFWMPTQERLKCLTGPREPPWSLCLRSHISGDRGDGGGGGGWVRGGWVGGGQDGYKGPKSLGIFPPSSLTVAAWFSFISPYQTKPRPRHLVPE